VSTAIFLFYGIGYHIQMHVFLFNPTLIAHVANLAKLY